MISGTDISTYQPTYKPVKGDAFIFVKATEGSTWKSNTHDAQVAAARKAGKVVGHYHWIWPGNIDRQIEWFAKNAKVQPGDVIIVDWENSAKNGLVSVKDKDAMLKGLKKKFPKNRVLLYTYTFYGPFAKVNQKTYVADGLWIADYRTSVPKVDWLFWQYTDKPIDKNHAQFKDVEALKTWAAFSTAPVLKPESKPAPASPPQAPKITDPTMKGITMTAATSVYFRNTADQQLKVGENVLKINADNDVSVVVGANDGIDVVAGLEFLNTGNQPLEVFWRVLDYKSGTPDVVYADRVPVTVTSSSPKVQCTYKGGLPAPSATGRSMRLRLIVRVPAPLPLEPGEVAPPLPSVSDLQVSGWKC